MELLSDAVPANASPIGSRYDHQIALFGKDYQDKLEAQNVFIVGYLATPLAYPMPFRFVQIWHC
jgi:hypothetical protein